MLKFTVLPLSVIFFLSACNTSSVQPEKREPAQSQVSEFSTKAQSNFSQNVDHETSLPCDKATVSNYMNNKIADYNMMAQRGDLTAKEAQSLIRGTHDLVEMQSLACGWTKVKTKQSLNFCEEQKAERKKWEQEFENGLLTKRNIESLIRGQKDLAQTANQKCD